MFKTIKRIIDWCGEFKGKLYIGFLFSFFSNIFAAMPIMVAAYTVGMLIEAEKGATMLSIAGTSSHEMGFCHPFIPT